MAGHFIAGVDGDWQEANTIIILLTFLVVLFIISWKRLYLTTILKTVVEQPNHSLSSSLSCSWIGVNNNINMHIMPGGIHLLLHDLI